MLLPILVLAVALMTVEARPARATADGPDHYAVTGVAAGDVLNVRAEPSADSAKIGEIPADGRGLRNLGCRGVPTFAEWEAMTPAERERAGKQRWCKVRYGAVEGWVAGRFLKEDSGQPR